MLKSQFLFNLKVCFIRKCALAPIISRSNYQQKPKKRLSLRAAADIMPEAIVSPLSTSGWIVTSGSCSYS